MMILKILLVPFLVVILLSIVMVIGSMGLAPETSEKRKAHTSTALEPTLPTSSITGAHSAQLVQMDDAEISNPQAEVAFMADKNQLNFDTSSGYLINI